MTVEDNIDPTLTTDNITIQLDGSGVATLTPADVTNATSDNCGTPTVTVDQDTFDCTEVGANTIDVTSTDSSGNSVTETATVTVEDTVDPTAVCQDITVILDTNGEAFITAADVDGGSTDNCGIQTISVSETDFTIADLGDNTVTLTVTDENGNTDTCTATVTVFDDNPPVANCQDVTIQLDATGNASITAADIDNGSTDNGSIASLVLDQTDFDCSHLGDNTVTLTVTDDAGNTATCSATVTVEDSIDPTLIECVANKFFTLTDCSYVMGDFRSDVQFFDNCDIDLIQVYQNPAPGTDFQGEQVINVIIELVDESNNSTVCSFEIALSDIAPPSITCGEDMVVLGNANCEYVLEDFTDYVTVFDECDGDVEVTQSPSIGEVISGHGSSQIVTLTATDESGNSSSCDFIITLEDSTNPEITCIENQTIEAAENCSVEIPNYLTNIEVSDNCLETTLQQSPTPGTLIAFGESEVTISVTDINNNTQSCSFSINVIDVTPPSVNCLPDITVPNDIGNCGAQVNFEMPMAEDNCEVSSVELTSGINSGEEFPIGTTEMEITVMDSSGNITTCQFTVTVFDTEDPIVTCPENQELEVNDNCMAVLPDYTSLVEIVDNCSSIFSIDQTPEPGAVITDNQLVGITVTDESGNAVVCGFTVELVDTTSPNIECEDDIIQTDQTVFYNLPIVSDNCAAELFLINGYNPGDMFPIGQTEVTYVAIDLAGNTDTCSFNVYVNSPPVGINDSLYLESHISTSDVNVLENDSDPDGDEITLSDAWTSNTNSSIWIDEDGTIEYQVFDNWCGIDTITYVLCDVYDACSEAQLIIEVECFNGITLPEGFSPDGDGTNDVLEIPGVLHYPESVVEVYNRWGRLVFQSIGYQNNWNGMSTDEYTVGTGLLPEGTYFVLLDLKDGNIPLKSYIYIRY